MGFWKRQSASLRVILASANPQAIESLTRLRRDGHEGKGKEAFDLEVIEALTTQGVYSTLSKGRFHLIIVDLDELPETGLSREALQGILARNNIPYISAEEFALNPDRWEGEVAAVGRDLPEPPCPGGGPDLLLWGRGEDDDCPRWGSVLCPADPSPRGGD